jgi:hypothetical protein
MTDAWMSRHAWDGPAAGPASVPGQRARSEAPDTAAGGTAAGDTGTAAGHRSPGG